MIAQNDIFFNNFLFVGVYLFCDFCGCAAPQSAKWPPSEYRSIKKGKDIIFYYGGIIFSFKVGIKSYKVGR